VSRGGGGESAATSEMPESEGSAGMNQVLTVEDSSSFALLQSHLGGAGSARIQEVRAAARRRFVELGFPTQRLEAWKHTDVSAIARLRFAVAPPLAHLDAERVGRRALADLTPVDLPGSRLVFVNGRHVPALSSLGDGLPAGVRVQGLAAALGADGAVLEQHLTRYAPQDEHAFVALNTAYWEDGAAICIPPSQVVRDPIHLVFVSTPGAAPTATFPRVLVLAGEASQATILETYVGLAASAPYFTNSVTELVLGPNAVLEHCKVQGEAENSFHIAVLQAHLGRGSRFTSHSLALGGALGRHETRVLLDGEGAECTLDGLYVPGGRQHLDNQTFVDHARPQGTSRQLYKGILSGSARAVFNGGVRVQKGAQKTDAKQTNKNLILSADALVDTKPQLVIFADDVRCTHGATIGRLDEDAIYYLRTRGIDPDAARGILTLAFAEEVLARLTPEPVRAAVTAALRQRLSGVLALEEGSP